MAKHLTHLLLQTWQPGDLEFRATWEVIRWQPRADICRTREEVLIHVEAAGLDVDNLRLHYEPGQLIVEGQRDKPALPCASHCIQVEIDYGSFRRAFPLPPEADGEHIKAQYQAGLLLITVPLMKPDVSQTVRVNID